MLWVGDIIEEADGGGAPEKLLEKCIEEKFLHT